MNKIRVLIVDDETLLLDLMARTFKLVEAIDLVGTAGSGREAIQIALEAKPDIILMDVDKKPAGGSRAVRLQGGRPAVRSRQDKQKPLF